MTYQRREEIFSKEALTLDDVVELTGRSKGAASRLIQEWKMQVERKNGAIRLSIQGTIHILDYFDAMGIDHQSPGERYVKPKRQEEHRNALSDYPRRTFCI